MKTKWFDRVVAVILIFTLALISPMQFVRSDAATKSVKYIKEFKLFVKKEGSQADAEAWCKSQTDGDWHVLEGDLNDGTDGTFSKPVGVFLCYTTTEDVKQAVTDIAVMNEKGNYSESAYEAIVKEQRDAYKDLVKNLKIQIKNYQKNYKDNVKTAVEAHDLLNGYKEDDSGKLLGDLLAELDPEQEKDEEKLIEILLQSNGNVVLFIQQELALASESGNRSWLDRMEQVGGYDKFYNKIKTAFNGDDGLAKRNMDIKYKEKATAIADDWDNLKKHLDNVKEYEEKNKILSMNEEQLKAWRENNKKSPEGMSYEQDRAMATNLANYKYDGKTLLNFFYQDKSEISGSNLYKLYPMVASLQEGQLAGVDTTVSLYSLIDQAFSATLLNDYNKGKLQEVKAEANQAQKKKLDDAQKDIEDFIDQQKKTEVKSIYEGVDREIFKGGVAVTSDALQYSKGSETKWTDAVIGRSQQIAIISVLSVCFIANFFMYAACGSLFEKGAINALEAVYYEEAVGEISDEAVDMINKEFNRLNFTSRDALVNMERMANGGDDVAKEAVEFLYKQPNTYRTKGNIIMGLSIGLSIIFILASAADIALSVIALRDYYNREHLPIPKRMVDMSTNKEKETSYVVYKTVRDNSGEPGDLNGGSSKQWLALYQTYDDRAGQPILAPESEASMKVVYGKNRADNLSPLHMFGTPTVPQNLTFADGEEGWSYNDKNDGTYLFFSRSGDKVIEEEEEKEVVSEKKDEAASKNADVATSEAVSGSAVADDDQTGTALSGGYIVLIAAGVVIIAFCVILYTRKRGKREEE